METLSEIAAAARAYRLADGRLDDYVAAVEQGRRRWRAQQEAELQDEADDAQARLFALVDAIDAVAAEDRLNEESVA